ncbi:hypothetical protein LTR94_035262, partial [Friedmanniomyces endolithicus]
AAAVQFDDRAADAQADAHAAAARAEEGREDAGARLFRHARPGVGQGQLDLARIQAVARLYGQFAPGQVDAAHGV